MGQMIQNFRLFETGPDPFGRTWQVEFRWLQTGISIRHADTVDVKFEVATFESATQDELKAEEPKQERVIALRHPDLLALSKSTGHALTDPWCMKLAGSHLEHMILSGEDIEKTLVTVSAADLSRYAAQLAAPVAVV